MHPAPKEKSYFMRKNNRSRKHSKEYDGGDFGFSLICKEIDKKNLFVVTFPKKKWGQDNSTKKRLVVKDIFFFVKII